MAWDEDGAGSGCKNAKRMAILYKKEAGEQLEGLIVNLELSRHPAQIEWNLNGVIIKFGSIGCSVLRSCQE